MSELEKLRREQAARVMHVIGPLVDSWEGIPSDVKFADELEDFREHMAELYRAIGDA